MRIDRTRPLKRRLGREEIDQIVAKYRSGSSTHVLAADHHLAKRTIAALLRAQEVAMRRQGLSDVAGQSSYGALPSRSLACLDR